MPRLQVICCANASWTIRGTRFLDSFLFNYGQLSFQRYGLAT